MCCYLNVQFQGQRINEHTHIFIFTLPCTTVIQATDCDGGNGSSIVSRSKRLSSSSKRPSLLRGRNILLFKRYQTLFSWG